MHNDTKHMSNVNYKDPAKVNATFASEHFLRTN